MKAKPIGISKRKLKMSIKVFKEDNFPCWINQKLAKEICNNYLNNKIGYLFFDAENWLFKIKFDFYCFKNYLDFLANDKDRNEKEIVARIRKFLKNK
jgi:hypothetical protein